MESSLPMWHAVEVLATRLRAQDPALTLSQARADALTELVLQRADVTVFLHAITPTDPAPDPTDPAPDSGGAAGGHVEPCDAPIHLLEPGLTGVGEDVCAHKHQGAGQAPSGKAGEHDAATVGEADTATATRAGSGTAREGRDDRAGVAAALPAAATGTPQAGGRGAAFVALGRGLCEVSGIGPGTHLIDLDRLAGHARLTPSTPVTVHPESGALTGGHLPAGLGATPTRDPARTAPTYRVPADLQRLLRLRDGHCRFPGCVVAARYCDLDHVIPWPIGPTTVGNLACLCRRHHRVKQRHGWRAALLPDATMTWTDPTGHTRTTTPVDHLDRVTTIPTSKPGLATDKPFIPTGEPTMPTIPTVEPTMPTIPTIPTVPTGLVDAATVMPTGGPPHPPHRTPSTDDTSSTHDTRDETASSHQRPLPGRAIELSDIPSLLELHLERLLALREAGLMVAHDGISPATPASSFHGAGHDPPPF